MYQKNKCSTIGKHAPSLSSPTLIGRQLEIAFRLVILGESGVGKSSLIKRYVLKNFQEDYQQTIEDQYTKKMIIEDDVIDFDILDIGGF